MKYASKIIIFLYSLLFFLTPFLFTFYNSELFEIPKMYFVYLITVTISFFHLINWIKGNVSLYKKNILNLFFLIFLISQIICTLTSIDIHTSIFGYYSRLNGGLLSTISYFILFLFLTPYFNQKQKTNIINLSLISGLLVSIYGILEHFGINKNLWVQDVQSRVFSTLGQPNWLAAYLVILLPLSLHKYFESTNTQFEQSNKLSKQTTIQSCKYLLLTTTFYLTLLFTKSKSGILAAIISIFIFFILYIINFIKNTSLISKRGRLLLIKQGSFVLAIFLFLSLTITNPIKDLLLPQQSKILVPENPKSGFLITPSTDIRKIVWRGSLDLFKQFPLLGTGVETFAYSYYWTRPIEHNLTSEWDFLYNKAHNEYLNYLATTGLIGFIPYTLLILTVLFLLIKNSITNSKLEIRNISIALLSSYISILITNTAGFSVVIISLYFFIIPSLMINDSSINTPKPISRLKYLIPILLIIYITIIKNIIFSYIADLYFAKYESANSRQEYELAYQNISKSISLRPREPNYLINLATSAAKIAVLTKEQSFIDQAIRSSTEAVKISPANINLLKLQAQVYYYLSTIDSQHFIKTVESMIQASKLAPTDAKIPYSLGQFLESAGLIEDAIYYYQKSIELKPNYDHAYFALGKIFYEQKKFDLAKKNLETNLLYAPTNTESQKLLKEIPLINHSIPTSTTHLLSVPLIQSELLPQKILLDY